jgi:cytoskeletal protein RodZ
VYRRRRLVLLIALLAIVAVAWLLIAQPWQGRAEEAAAVSATKTPDGTTALPAVSSSPTPTATRTPTTKPSPSATPKTSMTRSPGATAAAKACAATDISVEAVADKTSYAAGQNPKLSIKLTNEGSAACTFNVGTTTQSFTITSGSDTWWRSTDCQTAPSDMIVLLKAGQTVASSQPVVWDRTRSSVSTCKSTSRPKAGGGGATYHLQVSIGGVPSHGDTMFLLY